MQNDYFATETFLSLRLMTYKWKSWATHKQPVYVQLLTMLAINDRDLKKLSIVEIYGFSSN